MNTRNRGAAAINLDAPARPSEARRVSAKSTRHSVTREPDIFDEVAGEAIWFGQDVFVVVPLERLDDFRSYVNSEGLAPCGRDAYQVIHLTVSDAKTWPTIRATVSPVSVTA